MAELGGGARLCSLIPRPCWTHCGIRTHRAEIWRWVPRLRDTHKTGCDVGSSSRARGSPLPLGPVLAGVTSFSLPPSSSLPPFFSQPSSPLLPEGVTGQEPQPFCTLVRLIPPNPGSIHNFGSLIPVIIKIKNTDRCMCLQMTVLPGERL